MAGYDKTICLSPFFHAIYIVASSMVRMNRKNQMTPDDLEDLEEPEDPEGPDGPEGPPGKSKRTNVEQYMKHK